MSERGASWVDEALREHEEHTTAEHAAAVDQAAEHGAAEHGTGGRPGSPSDREQQVLDRIDRARRRRPRIREERITMSHGAGGKATHTLIEAVFLDAFRNPLLEPLEDAAQLQVGGARLALTTDSYVVSPLFFPGGNIGDLAVNGTVNDLAVSGATPLYLSAGFVLEEGFPVADLTTIVASMTAAAAAAGVGVVEHDLALGAATARPGDAVIVSGPVGDHGVTIMLARGELDIEADLASDTAPMNTMIAGLLAAVPGVRAMRDATRGGVATILNEVAVAAGVGVLVEEDQIPVRTQVRGAAELLGIDPMYVACEGRLVAIVDGEQADRALAALHAHALGEQAAVIGRITTDQPGIVLLRTAFGGTRIVDLLVGDPLPRIC